MKYKAFLMDNGSGESGAGVTSFYTKSQAISCCEQWRQMSSRNFAYLWDGSTWTEYAPIP